jgi:hypothetical protein
MAEIRRMIIETLDNLIHERDEVNGRIAELEAQLAQRGTDNELRKAAQDVVHAWEHRHCDDADIAALKAALATQPAAPESASEHNYTSTACQHDLHDRCRKQCKFCAVLCKCACHTAAPPASQNAVVERMLEALWDAGFSFASSTRYGPRERRAMTAAYRVAIEEQDRQVVDALRIALGSEHRTEDGCIYSPRNDEYINAVIGAVEYTLRQSGAALSAQGGRE